MSVVIKTRTQTVGDVKEEVQYYFESYEDFIKFEFTGHEQSGVETESDTEIAEREKYEVVDNTSGHGFHIGEIVTASWMGKNTAICSNGRAFWYLNPEDLKEVR